MRASVVGTVSLGIACLVAAGTGCPGTRALKRRKGPEYEAETQSWIRVLQKRGGNGMWLVTRGYHPGDDVVAMATNSPLSHASVLDLDNKEVVEAISKGVVVTGLHKFLRETHRLVLIRPDGWTPQRGREFLARARGQVGKKYDYLGAVGLPQTKNWYCSELAAWSAGIRVNRKGPKHVLHPRNMHRYGTVLFDSGQRNGEPDD
jgi:hypothetical protein